MGGETETEEEKGLISRVMMRTRPGIPGHPGSARYVYVIIPTLINVLLYSTRRNKYPCHRIYSFGLSAADPLPSAFVMDVEDDPVVDVCRRNDLRGRSPVLD